MNIKLRHLNCFAVLLGFLVSISAVHAAETPTDWLPTKGKSSSWLQTTAKIREELAKLDTDQTLVKPYVARLRERAGWLAKTDTFIWNTIPAVHMLEAVLEDLNKGIVPYHRYSGEGIPLTYWSPRMKRLEAFWMQVPPDYDPAKDYQMCVYYKNGGGIHFKDGKARGGHRPSVEMARKDPHSFHVWSSLNIQSKGRQGIEEELIEIIAALGADFNVNPDRVFLSGYSDGGFSALWIASRHPHLVAGIFPTVANWQYSNTGDWGLLNVPMLVVDGWGDGGYLQRNLTRFQTLSHMGGPTQALLGHHGHTYTPFENEESFLRIMKWCSEQKRDLWPKRIRYATWGLSWNRAYWATIDRMTNPSLTSLIDIDVKDGNLIEVRATNVADLSLTLSDHLLDMSKPIRVVSGDRELYKGEARESITVSLETLPEGKFRKTQKNPGGIQTHMKLSMWARGDDYKVPGRLWSFVRPTGGTEAQRKLLPNPYAKWGTDDDKVSDKQLSERNLFCFGGPDMNKFVERIAPDLPITFGKGSFAIGNRTYDQPEQAVMFIHPNPLNPDRMLIIYAFNDLETAAGIETVKKMFFKNPASWGFRTGDCVVYANRKEPPMAFDIVTFDSNWRAPDQTVLGTATEHFMPADLLRLKADSIKAALDVDAVIIQNKQPNWSMWNSRLVKGPVILNDLATLSRFPEFPVIGTVKGSVLAGLHAKAKASTILSAESDAGHDKTLHMLAGEIDAKKTYTVAFDYMASATGPLSPGYSTKVLPRPFLFVEHVNEFYAQEGVRPRVTELRMAETEVVAAMAEFVRSRKTVTPRK